MKYRNPWLIAVVAGVLLVTGCSDKIWRSPNRLDDHELSKFGKKKEERDAKETGDAHSAAEAGIESTLTVGDGGGVLGGGGRRTKADLRMDKLFAGALDVVLDLPVIVASREGGIVATDWKVNPKDPNLRYRLNIRVSGQEPYGEVRVVVLKQGMQNGQWVDLPSDPQMAAQIQKAVRKRADVALQ